MCQLLLPPLALHLSHFNGAFADEKQKLSLTTDAPIRDDVDIGRNKKKSPNLLGGACSGPREEIVKSEIAA